MVTRFWKIALGLTGIVNVDQGAPAYMYVRDFLKALSVQSAGSMYSALFRAGEGEGCEEEKWHPTSVIALLVHVGSLTASSRRSHWLKE